MAGKFIYSPRVARRRGARDGRTWRWRLGWPLRVKKEPYPSVDSTDPPEFEKEVYSVAEQELHKMAEDWKERDKSLRTACAEAENNYFEVEKNMEKYSQKQQDAIKEYEKIKALFDSLSRPQSRFWRHAGHYIIFSFIFGAEFILNKKVFEIFGESNLVTYFIAIPIGLAIFLCSELIGHFLANEKRTRAVVASVSLFFALSAISYLRLKYFEAIGTEIFGISVSPLSFFLVFWVINLFLAFVCTLGAWQLVEKSKKIEATSVNPQEFKKIEKKFKEARERLSQQEIQIQQLAEKLVMARNRFDMAHFDRRMEFEKLQARAGALKKKAGNLIWIYRDANMHARQAEKSEEPQCFREVDPETRISIPSLLLELNCSKCRYDQLIGPPPPPPPPPPDKEGEGVGHVPVPLLLSESPDRNTARALFNSFTTGAGLQVAKDELPDRASLDPEELFLCLQGLPVNIRDSANFQDWEDAWRVLLSGWEGIDKRLLSACSQGYVYHLHIHLVLPLAFAVGATLGLRRAVVLYHQEGGRYFKVLDLTRSRVLFEKADSSVPEPEVIEEKNGQGQAKLVLHFFISERHALSLRNHPDWETADNAALVYRMALPEGNWLGYVQHLVGRGLELARDYQQVEVCLTCPAVVAFALGMAFSREPKFTVCQWFGTEQPPRYRPVFSLGKVEERLFFT
ncbi:hypothetical protein G7K71_12975 [Desulfofundulus sp. TPOSR]|uniref:hypothetical protein n=1 Tax=Desulfofundulus sp. TPOSR TaxID=2714340 RepID=UPI0014088C57|nr:hypothetical protein [Desulfofundulus sp. TPOSR]NHM27873.1 hypothetical protein [Desulfofundulus sp. TPOSR]